MSDDYTGMPKPMPRPNLLPTQPHVTNGHAVREFMDGSGGHLKCLNCGHRFTEAEQMGTAPLPSCPPEVPAEPDPMPADLPDRVLAELEGWADMTESERLALMVADVCGKLEERAHVATQMCATLEGQNAEALRHLQALVAIVHATGTTYAADTDAVEAACAFLEDVGSPETPEQPTEDH